MAGEVLRVWVGAQSAGHPGLGSEQGIAAVAAGIGIGKIGGSAMEAIARQPESTGDIRSNMIVIAALIEGVAFLALIVCVLAIIM